MQILSHKGTMIDLYPSLGLLPQIYKTNQRIASLHLNDTPPDDLALIRQRKMALLLILFQILSELIDSLIFRHRIHAIVISGHI